MSRALSILYISTSVCPTMIVKCGKVGGLVSIWLGWGLGHRGTSINPFPIHVYLMDIFQTLTLVLTECTLGTLGACGGTLGTCGATLCASGGTLGAFAYTVGI